MHADRCHLSKLTGQDFHIVPITPQHPANIMRLLQIVTAALLPFTALAAKKPSGDRFKDHHAKQLSNAGPVKLDDAAYDALTKAPRDYSVAVLLTALDARFACQLCHEFQPEWDLLSKLWIKGDKAAASRLLYGTLDFIDGRNTFQSVSCELGEIHLVGSLLMEGQMQLQTAPVLLLFSPTTGPHATGDFSPARFDFGAGYVVISSGRMIAEPVC